MINNKDITPYNNKNQPHGYWEMYWDDKLWFKTNCFNGNYKGYLEEYNCNLLIRGFGDNYNQLIDKRYYLI